MKLERIYINKGWVGQLWWRKESIRLERGNTVGRRTGERRPLLYAKENHEDHVCMLRCEECHGVVPCLGNQFSVPMTWTAMLIHCDNLGLSGDTVEKFSMLSLSTVLIS